MAPRLVFVFLAALAVVSSVRSEDKVRDAVRHKRSAGYYDDYTHGDSYGRDDGYGSNDYGYDSHGKGDGYGKHGGYGGGFDDGYGKHGGYGGGYDRHGQHGGYGGGYDDRHGHHGGYGGGYDDRHGQYGGYSGHGDGYGRHGGHRGHDKGGYGHGGYEYTSYHSVKPQPFKTTVTQTVEKEDLTPKTDDNKNNVQMSLSYICNTKMQSKDKEETGYSDPHGRKADGNTDAAYEEMDDNPMYHHPNPYGSSSDSYGSSSSSSSSSSGSNSRLYIRRPRHEYSSVPSQHIGPNMDIACAGVKPNFL